MKILLRFFLLTLVISSCTPEDLVNDPETNIPPKIKMVKLIKNADTTTYEFQYNLDTTKLVSVLRDGDLYATLSYTTNEVILDMKMNTNYNDSFLAKISSSNYIDSLKNTRIEVAFFGLGNPVSITRGVNNKIFESRNFLNEYIKRDGYFSGYTKLETNSFSSEYNIDNNNLIKYIATATQGLSSLSYRDTIIYNLAQINQPNLPDQFATNFQSYFVLQGKPILTPMFLLQQSNIYTYRTHTNLVYQWLTSEVSFPGFPTELKTDYLYQYNYSFDSRSRVTQMDVSVNSSNYLTYQFIYFN